MYCTKCGKQISDDSKFCDGCGNPVAAKVAEPYAAQIETESVREETQGQLTEHTDPLTNAEPQACTVSEEESAPATEETSSERSAETQRSSAESTDTQSTTIVLNPETLKLKQQVEETAKKSFTLFKSLSPKKKRILLAVPIIILLVVVIVSGAGKADVVSYPCDNGAILDMDLETFSDNFSKSVKKYEKVEIDLLDIWQTPSSGKEDSGAYFQLYAASPYTDVQLYAKTIDNKIAGIIVSSDYSSATYKDNMSVVGKLFLHAANACGKHDADEMQDILKQILDGVDASKKKTSYISGGMKYSVAPDKIGWGNGRIVGYTLTVEPVSSDFVSNLNDHIVHNDF